MLAGTVAATTTEGDTATAAPTTPAPALATDALFPEPGVAFEVVPELALELPDTDPLALAAVAALAPLPLAATDAVALEAPPSPPPPPPQATSTSDNALEHKDKLRFERAFISKLHLIVAIDVA